MMEISRKLISNGSFSYLNYQSAAIILCEFLYWINLANKLTLFLTSPGNVSQQLIFKPQ